MRSVLLLFMLSLIATATTLRADEQTQNSKHNQAQPSMKADEYIQRNFRTRAMMDLVQMPLATMKDGWSVIEIEPGERSGAGYLGSGPGRIEKELRNLTKVHAWINYEGKWKRLAIQDADSDIPHTGKFRWFEPWVIRGFLFRPAPDENRFKNYAFQYGGTILCRHDLSGLDGNPFKDAFLLPKEEAWTKAAHEIVTHPELAQRVEAAIRANRPQELTKVRNPLLAIYTVRRLLETDGIQVARRESIVRDLWAANDLAQPGLAFLLSRPPEKATESAEKLLSTLILRTESREELSRLAEGLFVSRWIAGSEADHTSIARLLPYFTSVLKRARQLNAVELVQRLELFLET